MICPVTRHLLVMALLILLPGFCLLPSVRGQSASATLSGNIEDQNGAVVPGVRVTVMNIATGLKRETLTNDSGLFTVPLLPPGTYNVKTEREGFSPLETRDVVLNVGDQKALRIQLKAGDVNAQVIVNSDAETVRTDGSVGTVVDRQFVANIPLNGRSFQSLLTLTPGVQIVPSSSSKGQFSVNGQRPSANAFLIDGVSANFGISNGFPSAQTGGNLPALTTFGSTQSLMSVDALEEFKVQTSGTSAEYGRQPGGQISMVTRPGSNQFHGSAFDYVRNDKFDANDWFANANRQRRPPERQNDFGGTFSGPVLLPRFDGHNRTFFFFSYEGLRLRLPQFTLTNVPSLSLRQTSAAGIQPVLSAFPLPNGKDLGNGLAEFSAAYSDPSNLDASSIRIDHAVSNKFSLFSRYNIAPSETIARRPADLANRSFSHLNTQGLTVGATFLATPNLTNQLRLNWSRNFGTLVFAFDNFGGAVPPARSLLIPSQYDSPNNVVQSAVQFRLTGGTATFPAIDLIPLQFFRQQQMNIIDSVSSEIGSHQLKFGIDYRSLTPVSSFNTYNLSINFVSATEVRNATAGTGFVFDQVDFHPIYHNFSAYGQDTWKVNRSLTLDLGLRWEVNPPPGEAAHNLPLAINTTNLATMQLEPRGTRLWKTTYNNLAPRFGIAYLLSQKSGGETVLRGGIGVYYDTGNEFGSMGFVQVPFADFRSVANVAFPLSAAQLAPPVLGPLNPPYPASLNLFDPNLKQPYTIQWNVAVQRSLGSKQSVTLEYVGAAGRRLLQQQRFTLGAGTVNQSFSTILLTLNAATSDYHGLQAQFQRRLSRGLQALMSYTWSHAIDDDSAANTGKFPVRGNADFDVRHNFATAVTYDIPTFSTNGWVEKALGHWSLDTSVHAQTGLPVDVLSSTLIDPVTRTTLNIRPNLITGIPLYLYGSQYPGGRTINNTAPTAAQVVAAGCVPLTATNAKGPFCTPLLGHIGTLGRNVLRALPAWQVDIAVRRQISLSEKIKLQLRSEAFNLFNHPNLGAISTTLTAANFGQATNMLNRQLGGLNQLYQIGGPRSMQFAVKLLF